MRSRIALVTAVASMSAAGFAGPAEAGNIRALETDEAGIGRAVSDSSTDSRQRRSSAFSPLGRAAAAPAPYLPGKVENFELVGKYDIPGVFPGQIADVAVHKGYAYLNSWDDPGCAKGGFYVVDIRDPANPQPVGDLVPAKPGYYHGEGAHAVTINTPQFQGDLLAVNNETYSGTGPGCPTDKTGGGFDLYDVSDPANPEPLVVAAGDKAADGALEPQNEANPNSYHSVWVWQDGPRAYLVGVDNTELADVDVFDITDPTAPEQIADWDLVELFPEIVSEGANGMQIFHHDTVVKDIGGKKVMMVNYWDAGYVQLDVSTPEDDPVLITDTDFDDPDPLTGLNPPEGNGHQGEFSADNEFLLAADEDFSPFRSALTTPLGNAVVAEGDAKPISTLPDGALDGPSTFIGDGCNPANVPAAPADDGDPETDDIALIERGGTLPDGVTSCGFAHKFANAAAAGWDGVVVFNQVRPAGQDTVVNMSTGPGTIPGVIITRANALGAEGVLSTSTTTPAPGTAGPAVSVAQTFDGWGYAHLYDAQTSEELDAYAIPEALDERYAAGFGDLSIHEFATDPTADLAYSAYYAGGMRAFRFSRDEGLVPTATYIEDDGSNYWGVEAYTAPNGETLIAGSDRDKGLRILRYTGPGAVGPQGSSPAPPPAGGAGDGGGAGAGGGASTSTPVAGSSPSGRATIRAVLGSGYNPKSGRLTARFAAPAAGVLRTRLTARIGGKAVTLGTAKRVVMRAGTYQLTVRLNKVSKAALRRALRRSSSKRLKATLASSFTGADGKPITAQQTVTLR